MFHGKSASHAPPTDIQEVTIAAIGDQPITLPVIIRKKDYDSFKPRYSINIIYTFTQGATEKAKYTLTIRDSDGNVVDQPIVRRPKNKPLPAMVLRNYAFEVV